MNGIEASIDASVYAITDIQWDLYEKFFQSEREHITLGESICYFELPKCSRLDDRKRMILRDLLLCEIGRQVSGLPPIDKSTLINGPH